MAYQTGTATNHIDLLDKLVTFLSTWLGAAENWQVLRYTGVSEIDASSFVVNWEPWKAIKGPYHNHDNGWATASGQHLNCWFRVKLVQPLDITRIKITGSQTANQSPKDFILQWSNDGTTWNDRMTFANVTWADSEVKEFAITGVSPGAKQHWRLFISTNNGNTSTTAITKFWIPEFQGFQDFDHARRPAAWLKAPGMTGTDPCYINFQSYDRPTDDYYNIAVTGATGYVAANSFDDQPGALTAMAIPMWNQPIPYWFSGNGQRVVLVAKISTVYVAAYLGKMLPYGTPQQFPYPLIVAAPLPGATGTRYSDTSVNLPFKGNRTNMKLRTVAGTWIQPNAWPYSTTNSFRDVTGQYPLLPITLYDTANTYGVMDGVSFVTGFSNAPENTITVGSETHTVFTETNKTGINDFFVMRTA
jgi:hypothetical protein